MEGGERLTGEEVRWRGLLVCHKLWGASSSWQLSRECLGSGRSPMVAGQILWGAAQGVAGAVGNKLEDLAEGCNTGGCELAADRTCCYKITSPVCPAPVGMPLLWSWTPDHCVEVVQHENLLKEGQT